MERDAQIWQDLLHASGGGLELIKTSYHILYFTFLSNGTSQAVLEPAKATIHLWDSADGRGIPITALAANQAHKTLGHYKSPADRQLTELEKAKKKRYSILISTSPITRYGATLAYHSVFLPTIKYPLPQSFFACKALKKIESKVMGPIFAECGYNRHMASALLYAPTYCAGGGFVHFYTLQGEGQIKNFLKHWRTDSLISQMLKINVAWAQWQSGISHEILYDTQTPLHHLECRWLKSLQEFLAHAQATIHLDTICVNPPERQGDIYIMDYALRSGLFDAEAIRIINNRRLYLHVTTVSELFDADGTAIIPDIFKCHRSTWFDPSIIITIQQRPSSHQIKYR